VVASRAIAEFLEGDKTLEQVKLIFFQPPSAESFLKHARFSS